MFPALNMELEIVRTVLKNEVNEIYVCTDLLGGTGKFYTMISIAGPAQKKLVAEKLGSESFFFDNRDFIGSFVYGNKLNLVFCYYHENLLSQMGEIYLYNFVECKRAALNLIAGFAESGALADMGVLLLNDRNINITKEGGIRLNYFCDFSRLEEGTSEKEFRNQVAEAAFGILELNYKDRYESREFYPDDLRLFYLKLRSTGFQSFGQMITTIRGMSDKPVEMRGFFWWIRNRFRMTRNFLFRNSMNTFLTLLVFATLIYAGFQITIRLRAHSAYEKNLSYYGTEYIGNVYLGDQE